MNTRRFSIASICAYMVGCLPALGGRHCFRYFSSYHSYLHFLFCLFVSQLTLLHTTSLPLSSHSNILRQSINRLLEHTVSAQDGIHIIFTLSFFFFFFTVSLAFFLCTLRQRSEKLDICYLMNYEEKRNEWEEMTESVEMKETTGKHERRKDVQR